MLGSRALTVGGLTVGTCCSCASESLLSGFLGSMCIGGWGTIIGTPRGVKKVFP